VQRYDLPRTDLKAKIGKVLLKPSFALGGYLVFLPTAGADAMMMGDLVLTENEIEPVLLKPESSGVFLDAKGGSHPWSIGQAHALQWDGAPSLPAGVVFTPLSWTGAATNDEWAKDKASLDMLAKQGIHDLALAAGAKGLTHVPPAAVQINAPYDLDTRYSLKRTTSWAGWRTTSMEW